MTLPLNKYGGHPDAVVVVSWVLLEGNTIEDGGGPTIEEKREDPAISSEATVRRELEERGG